MKNGVLLKILLAFSSVEIKYISRYWYSNVSVAACCIVVVEEVETHRLV